MSGKKLIEVRTLIGFLILAIGALLLLQNFGLIGFRISKIIFHWYTILILIGLVLVFTSINLTSGLILITIGTIGYMPELWPIVLIGLGLYIILKVRETPKEKNEKISHTEAVFNSMEINEVAIFGGGKKFIQSENFRGGKITTIFGGLEINLNESKLAEGENRIELFAMFGGSTIYVPSDWKVELDVISIFGGFSDSRKFISNQNENTTKVLKIKGLVFFGGGEIKN
jgi:predicted membrane protein